MWWRSSTLRRAWQRTDPHAQLRALQALRPSLWGPDGPPPAPPGTEPSTAAACDFALSGAARLSARASTCSTSRTGSPMSSAWTQWPAARQTSSWPCASSTTTRHASREDIAAAGPCEVLRWRPEARPHVTSEGRPRCCVRSSDRKRALIGARPWIAAIPSSRSVARCAIHTAVPVAASPAFHASLNGSGLPTARSCTSSAGRTGHLRAQSWTRDPRTALAGERHTMRSCACGQPHPRRSADELLDQRVRTRAC